MAVETSADARAAVESTEPEVAQPSNPKKRAKTRTKSRNAIATPKPATQNAYSEQAQVSPTMHRWDTMSPSAPHAYALPPGWEAAADGDEGSVPSAQPYVIPAWVDDHGRPYMYYPQVILSLVLHSENRNPRLIDRDV